MTKKTDASRFIHAALASGLVRREDFLKAEQLLTARGELRQPATDEQLADVLVEMSVLTPYQADQLRAGRIKLTLGPYLVTDFIGQGGMGQVFKAVHQVMGRVTAVKVLPQHKSTPDSIVNFQREIRTQAQLDHPNLVRAFDAGHDGNVHYLVTEFVPGMDLRRLVRRQGPLNMQQAASIIMQAAYGLHYAHQRGLIHRDVKPGNILVTPKGEAKVSDLGLAGCIDSDDEPESLAGKIVGTADYLSPEQIRTPGDITSASDIYSLGCTLYYAVTGKVPFPGGSTKEKSRRHCHDTPWHPRRFNQDVSEEFVEIIADMMEKDPKNRIQSAAEVAARLDAWAGAEVAVAPQFLGNSPWAPPPPPGHDESQDTNVGSYDEPELMFQELSDSGGADQVSQTSQASQGTERSSPSLQDTSPSRSRPNPPPVAPSSVSLSGGQPVLERGGASSSLAVVIALAIAVPVSMLLGSAVTILLLRWF